MTNTNLNKNKHNAEDDSDTTTQFMATTSPFSNTFLNPAQTKKIVISFDFGTSGLAFAWGFRSGPGNLNGVTDVYGSPWDWCGGAFGGKTDAAVVMECVKFEEEGDGGSGSAGGGELVRVHSFGRRAVAFARNLRGAERESGRFVFFHRFKMLMYEAGLRHDTKVKDVFNKKEMPLVDVVALCLKEMKKEAWEVINKTGPRIQEKDALYVVTVPAIWTDSAKQMMYNAAEKAGLTITIPSPASSSSSSSKAELEPCVQGPRLALEPVAASFWCMKEKTIDVGPGQIFIVADLGGGTVDLTVHFISNIVKASGANVVHEVVPACGGGWGSTTIDAHFFKFLRTLFNPLESDTPNQRNSNVIELIMGETWERIKCAYEGSDDDVFIPLSAELLEAMEMDELDVDERIQTFNDQFAEMDGGELAFEHSNLVIPHTIMKSFFQPCINNIVNHLKDTILKIKSEKTASGGKPYTTPSVIVAVGNFSNCKPLIQSLRHAFEPIGIRIVVPQDPGMCVVKGAVLLAFGGAEDAPVRKMQRGYGVKTSRPSDHGDPEDFMVEVNGFRYTRNVLDLFVDVGEMVEEGRVVERTYYPLQKGACAISFLVFETRGVMSLFTTAAGVKQVARVRVEGDPMALEAGVKVSMLFGGAQILVTATSADGTKQKASIDFLNAGNAL
ncbi:hypothetical protein HDU76_000806 [Blyttiomyces sp. JEL0837]|nr:hypothetical protein HDU76_000806 [Blyttiomyces sp. JEL0837]